VRRASAGGRGRQARIAPAQPGQARNASALAAAARARWVSRAAGLAVLLVCSLLASGCGLLGKPAPLSADAPLDMSITSPEFTGGIIPAQFTCYGSGESPPIFWSGAPPGTKSLALIVDDSLAPISPRVYWIVFNIGADTTDLQTGPATRGPGGHRSAESILPPGARVAANTAGIAGYTPPCPVGAPHKYRFTVYALNTYFGSSLPNHARLLQAWTTIAAHVLGRGTVTYTALPSAGKAGRG
jgi:Raf kinase inhibitor-like YbhB/YbcL family protein